MYAVQDGAASGATQVASRIEAPDDLALCRACREPIGDAFDAVGIRLCGACIEALGSDRIDVRVGRGVEFARCHVTAETMGLDDVALRPQRPPGEIHEYPVCSSDRCGNWTAWACCRCLQPVCYVCCSDVPKTCAGCAGLDDDGLGDAQHGRPKKMEPGAS